MSGVPDILIGKDEQPKDKGCRGFMMLKND